MAIIKGPFSIKWGQNTIEDIEDLSVEHTIDSEDFQTIQGKTIELDGAYKVSATMTLLASDIPVLAVLLPQHYVANGGVMSTGETVTNAAGAIDIKAAECDESVIDNDLDIISCNNPSTVLRLVECRTKIEGVEIDNKLQKVMIKFVGNAAASEATMQFFIEGGITPES
jgi:hypothetical protein